MPKYLDHHKLKASLPAEAVKMAIEQIKGGKADQFGVKALNAFATKDEVWCYTEAANADAVHKSHEAKGMKVGRGDVKEVQSFV